MNNPAFFANGQIGIGVALLLLAMLAVKEVTRVLPGPHWQALSCALTVAMTPISVIFVATVAVLIVQSFY